MSSSLNENQTLFAPTLHTTERGPISLLIDSERPNWASVDPRGASIIHQIDGKTTVGQMIANYQNQYQLDWAKSWLHCQSFLQEMLRSGLISTTPLIRAPFPGRFEIVQMKQLSELWLHLTNTCNLACTHCLVSSSPTGIAGEGTAFWHKTIAQALALGTNRFYITGGEPFIRPDIFELIESILQSANLVILTNAILLRGDKLNRLSQFDPARLKLQISLDGPTAEQNDPIRGKGSFEATVRGIKEVIGAGFSPTLTAVVTESNCESLYEMVPLAARLGIKNLHLLLGHARGRATESKSLASPSNEKLLEIFLTVKRLTKEAGISFDNIETIKGKLTGRAGVISDLMNIGYESLCVYADGTVYPSAATASIPELAMGSLLDQSLSDIWKTAPVGEKIRRSTVQKKTKCKDCYLKYLCGGGDLEHTYLHSGSFLGEDPFSSFHEQLILDILFSIATERASQQTASGYDRPRLLAAMGESALFNPEKSGVVIEGGFEVALSRSSCVLSVNLDSARKVVQAFYTDAAESAQPALCCAGDYPFADVSHIPQGALDIAYGCGSPVPLAHLRAGETAVDLGSGGGIDCFVMAKAVGTAGQVVGIDMTDAMIAKATGFKKEVADNLGFDVVTFRKGVLEEIPLPEQFADVVLSNCVINLSANKQQVFGEIWRVLKDFGRTVLSDTVSEKPLPAGMKANPRLWGECVSGALTETQYLADLERAGFYGLSVVKKAFWKEVEGYRFYSVVIVGYKFEKKAGCDFIGQKAVYLGPMQAVVDEEGHLFPRNQPVEVCTDTAEKLRNPPYKESFLVIGGDAIEESKSSAGSCLPGQCC